MKEKVYCNECYYLESYRPPFGNYSYTCLYSENIKRKNNWLGEEASVKKPKDINKNNNCKWFKNKNSKGNSF